MALVRQRFNYITLVTMQTTYTMQINGEELEKRMAKIEKDLTKVLDLLGGNGIDKNDKGVVGSVNDLDDRLSKLEKFKDRILWVGIGMGIPSSIGILKILEIIFETFKH